MRKGYVCSLPFYLPLPSLYTFIGLSSAHLSGNFVCMGVGNNHSEGGCLPSLQSVSALLLFYVPGLELTTGSLWGEGYTSS